MSVGVGVNFSKPESESESLKFGWLRSPAYGDIWRCNTILNNIHLIYELKIKYLQKHTIFKILCVTRRDMEQYFDIKMKLFY